MKRWRWALLIVELFLFALILVLPSVDLPDFVLCRGTAPIAARSSLSFPAILSIVAIATQTPSLHRTRETIGKFTHPATCSNAQSLLSLFCILLC